MPTAALVRQLRMVQPKRLPLQGPGEHADAKKRLAGEGAAVHSATQNL
jgi:hypothetical protein